ncbi:MAG: hypothetical protein L6Q99_06370 [Planctomycetes bacterium]|nr:hypothetical protein [Planctomycetota bacterium]
MRSISLSRIPLALLAATSLAHAQIHAELVSVNAQGVSGNGMSGAYPAALSSDGRFVAFDSGATDLVPDDTNGRFDVFVRDTRLGTTRAVSVTPAGAPASLGGVAPRMSWDGRHVAFLSNSQDLVAAPVTRTCLFVRDMQLGTTELITLGHDGSAANGDTLYLDITPDGRFLAFSSAASNLLQNDSNLAIPDVFVLDRATGILEVVSRANDGAQGDFDSWEPSISADGRFVAFTSWASNLSDLDGFDWDVYLRDRTAGTTALVNRTAAGVGSTYYAEAPTISPDGSSVYFNSFSADLANFDVDGQFDAFRCDRLQQKVGLVSTVGNGDASDLPQVVGSTDAYGRLAGLDALGDGVLDPNEQNGFRDAGWVDVANDQMHLASVAANGSWGNHESFLAELSADGRSIAFGGRASNLAAGDVNGNQIDVFVARIGAPTVVAYCTAKTNSQGCVPRIDGAGALFVGLAAPSTVRVTGFVNQKTGLFVVGPNALGLPFGGGTLCVGVSKRTAAGSTGGSVGAADCSGGLELDLAALVKSGALPWAQVGTSLCIQGWQRDPLAAVVPIGLSDALRFEVLP